MLSNQLTPYIEEHLKQHAAFQLYWWKQTMWYGSLSKMFACGSGISTVSLAL